MQLLLGNRLPGPIIYVIISLNGESILPLIRDAIPRIAPTGIMVPTRRLPGP